MPGELTPDEAQAAYDAAIPVPLSEARIAEIVDFATRIAETERGASVAPQKERA